MGNRLDSISGRFQEIKKAFAEQRKIVTAERIVNGKQMTETCKNSQGQTLKVSVFIDRNGDGKFDASEATSVKYFDVQSRSRLTTEYRDTDGDGFADEVVKSDWTGNETVTKETPDEIHGKNHRMDFKYGFKWDSNGPMVVYGQNI